MWDAVHMDWLSYFHVFYEEISVLVCKKLDIATFIAHLRRLSVTVTAGVVIV